MRFTQVIIIIADWQVAWWEIRKVGNQCVLHGIGIICKLPKYRYISRRWILQHHFLLTKRVPVGTSGTLWSRHLIHAVFTLHTTWIKSRRFIDCHLWLHRGRQEDIIRCHVINRVVHVTITCLVDASFHFHLTVSLLLLLTNLIYRTLLCERRWGWGCLGCWRLARVMLAAWKCVCRMKKEEEWIISLALITGVDC